MSGKATNKISSLKKLYATSAIAASVVALGTTAHADGVFGSSTSATNANISTSGSTTTVTVTGKSSIVDTNGLHVGSGQTLDYESLVGQANNLTRVTGSAAEIYGNVTSHNVNVYLVDTSGVLIGKNASINVPNLMVSTSDITNANFTAGNYNFNIKGNPDAKIINHGAITIADGGLAAFVAPTVINDGLIVANNGKVVLAGGQQFTVDMYGDKLINFAVSDDQETHLVKQSGKIAAANGVVVLTVQDANKVVNNVVNLNGVVEAQTVKVSGDEIDLGANAVINASGANGGGNVSLNANKKLSIAKTARIAADALVNGNGGNISIISGDELDLNGQISAKGAGTGTGGNIETSGANVYFGDGLSIDTTDGNGGAGQWLLDPVTLTIDNNVNPFNPNLINNVVLDGLLTLNNVTIATNSLLQAADTININAAIDSLALNTRTLTFQSNNAINLSSSGSITGDSAKLNVNFDTNGTVDLAGKVNTNGGNVTVANKAGTGNNTSFSLDSGSVLNAGTGSVTVNSTTANLNAAITAATISGNATTVNVESPSAIINQGIDIAKTSGATVNLGAGTYDQSVVINGKTNLTLTNPGLPNTVTIKPTSTPGSANQFKNFYDATINDSIVLVQNGSANITNVIVDGSGAPASANGHRLVGIGYNNASGTVTSTSQGSATDVVAQADTTGGDTAAQTVNVTSSSIKSFTTSGVEVDGNKLTAHVDGNYTRTDSPVLFGIKAGHGVAGDINTNDFSGYTANGAVEISLDSVASGFTINNNGLSQGAANTTGIAVNNSTGVIISNQAISGNATDIKLTNSTATISGSSIDNGVNGLYLTGSTSSVAFTGTTNEFSGETGQYIRLENGAYYGQAPLDVSNVSFDIGSGNSEVLAGDATDLQSFTLEDKIFHQLDDATLGLVTWKNNELFATNATGIQAAINASSTGGTVKVAGGIYDESLYIVGKNLTLTKGDGVTGTVTVAPDSKHAPTAAHTFKDFYDSTNNTPIILAQNAASVNISNIIVDGSGLSKISSSGNRLVGIGYDNAGGTDSGVTVQNIANGSKGTGIVVQSNSTDVNFPAQASDNANTYTLNGNSLVTNYQVSGVEVDGNKLTAHVDNNTINGKTQTIGIGKFSTTIGVSTIGIEAGHGVTGDVNKNTVKNILTGSDIILSSAADHFEVGGNDLTNGSLLATGISVTGSNYANLHDNKINGDLTGISVSGGTGVTSTGDILNGNVTGINGNTTTGLTLSGDSITGGGTGVSLTSSTGATISGTTITQALITGVSASKSTGLTINKGSNINTTLTGVTLTNGSNGATIDDSQISLTTTGVSANASTGLHVVNGTTITGSLVAGIALANGSNDAVVDDATLTLNVTGISANASTGLKVQDGSSITLGVTGISLTNHSNNVSVTDSTVGANTTADVSADNSTYLTIDHSIVGASTTAVKLTNHSDFATINNSLIGINTTGVSANNSDSLHITGGTIITGNTTGVDLAAGSDNALIQKSTVTLNTIGVNANASTGLTVDGGFIIGNKAQGINLAAASNGTTIKNGATVTLNATGIQSNASTGLDVTGSYILANATGIDLENNSTATVENHSLVSLNTTAGINANHSTILLDDSIVSLSPVGISLSNFAVGEVEDHSIITLNTTGIDSNLSSLFVDKSAIGINTTGINLSNNSGATVQDSLIAVNTTGINADNSSLVVDGSIVALNTTGINLTNSGSNTAKVDDKSIITLNDTGISADNYKGLTVDHSFVVLNKTDGIKLTDHSNFAHITNSVIGGNETGIYADDSYGLHVYKSLVIGNSDTGISLVGSNGAKVIDSTVTLSNTGISADDSKYLTVSNTDVSLNKTGIDLEHGSDHATIDNGSKIFLNLVGIVDDHSSHLNIDGSSVYANVVGADVKGSYGLDIDDSTFSYNFIGLNLDHSYHATVEDGSTFKDNVFGIKAKNSDKLKVADSSFDHNFNTAIDLYKSDHATITGTLISNSVYGVYADNSKYLTINSDGSPIPQLEGGQTVIIPLANTNISDNFFGVKLVNGSDHATINDVNITGNKIGVEAYKSSKLTIADSTIRGNDWDGVKLSDSFGDKITDGYISWNGTGVNADNANFLTINGTDFSSNNTAIDLSHSHKALIENANIHDNFDYGIIVNASSATSTGNTLSNNDTGIDVKHGGKLTIGTTSISGGTTGLLIDGVHSTVVFNDGDSFSGQATSDVTQYIRLANGAYSESAPLWVGNVTFDGVLASSLDPSDVGNFAIEDKIFHQMDDNSLGLVMWQNDALYADKHNLGIQQGINSTTSDGWTVYINTGEYDENLTIDKGITLIGQGNGLDPAVDTIINGRDDTAVTVNAGDKNVLLQDLTVTTTGAPYAILVDGTEFVQAPPQDGGDNEDRPEFLPLIVPGVPTPGPINFSMTNVLFSGTQTDAALQFQNATTVGGGQYSGVHFASTAPNGWQFVNVSGQAPKNFYNLGGDIDFGNTVFENSYNVAAIHLVNTTMDGDATHATFVGDGGSPFVREDRVIHFFDNHALGVIFYNGLDVVIAASELGNLAADIANRTDLGDVYYNALSVIGKVLDKPQLRAAKFKTFNTNFNTKIDISGNPNVPQTITIPGITAAQLAGLTTGSGGNGKGKGHHNSADQLNNLTTGAGGGGGPGKGFTTANCSVNFGNSFLSDSVGSVSGSCQ